MDVQNNGKQITNPVFPAGVALSNDRRKSFVLQGEHKRNWKAENPDNRIGICLKIDGALITDNNINKCDAGLLLDDNRLYLVEFKGNDYSQAVNQVIETKKFFKTNYATIDFVFYARVVGKSFPKANTKLQNAKKLLSKNFPEHYNFVESGKTELI